MKRALLLSFIVALTTSAHAEIVRRNIGVKQILPGNQTTVSGNGTGVVTVAVDGAVAVDTTTLKARVDQIGIDTGTLQSAVATATGTLGIRLSTFTEFQNGFNSGMNSSTNAFNVSFATTSDQLNSLRISSQNFATQISTTITEMKDRSVPVRFSDEGTNLANATAVDCVGSGLTCTASGSTITLTASGGTDTNYKTSTIYLATAGAVSGSADIFDNYGATRAIIAVGAGGLTAGGSTVTATINVGSGVYQTLITTIPVGIDFTGIYGSSTVFVLTATNQTMFTVYGSFRNFIIDCSSLPFKADILVVKQGATVENVKYENCINRGTGANGTYLYMTSDYTSGNAYVVPSTTVARVKNFWIDGQQGIADFTSSGDSAEFKIKYAQRLEINDSYFGHPYKASGAGESSWLIDTSSWVYFNRSEWAGTRGRNITLRGNMGPIGWDNCTFRLKYNAGNYASDGGLISFFHNNGMPAGINTTISTGSYITNSKFINEYGDWGSAMIYTATAGNVYGLYVSGNVVDSINYPSASATFISLGDASTIGTIITNNRTQGISTFLSDAGAGTKNASNNFKNGIAQGTAQ